MITARLCGSATATVDALADCFKWVADQLDRYPWILTLIVGAAWLLVLG
ncbi:hypothetical protein [Micromonospora sp. HUAS LYJ1]|nr:hypothetical protein [Micromonospora sp. HUAS LYJ1]WKU07995.1 hypothetical protein Q2K16_13680 [Micromonospora sp. HUAS LYJ1]